MINHKFSINYVWFPQPPFLRHYTGDSANKILPINCKHAQLHFCVQMNRITNQLIKLIEFSATTTESSCFAATEYLGSLSNSLSNKLLILTLGLEQLDFWISEDFGIWNIINSTASTITAGLSIYVFIVSHNWMFVFEVCRFEFW